MSTAHPWCEHTWRSLWSHDPDSRIAARAGAVLAPDLSRVHGADVHRHHRARTGIVRSAHLRMPELQVFRDHGHSLLAPFRPRTRDAAAAVRAGVPLPRSVDLNLPRRRP